MIDYSKYPVEVQINALKLFRESLVQQIKLVDSDLSKLLGKNSVQTSFFIQPAESGKIDTVGRKGSIGWKFLIDDVLKDLVNFVSAGEIVDRVMANPQVTASIEVAKKSIGSALSTNSTEDKPRYLKRRDKGVTVYAINPDYKE